MLYEPCTENYKPSANTEVELAAYFDNIITSEHDYNTSAEAITDGAMLGYNYVANKLGCTGFQAGWARMKFLQRAGGIKGPFMVIKLEDCLYPQYDVVDRLENFIEENQEWLRVEAQKLIDSSRDEFPPHPNVLAHWKVLANND